MARPPPALPGPGPRRPATLADLAAIPTTHIAHLIDGKIHAFPRPRLEHGLAMGSLLDELMGPFHKGRNGPGGWMLLPEPELHVAGEVVVPDLAGWRRERLPGAHGAFATVAPDWVCEVLSPGTEYFDRGIKADWYSKAGVGWLWLVDPEARGLEVFRNDAGVWRPEGSWRGSVSVAACPFEALSWPLDALWG